MNQQEINLILDKHSKWLNDEEGGERANLSNANLSDADLRCANLMGANLSNADLRCANLSNANFSYANLRCADLRCANLMGANLCDANLRSANFSYANLSYANLRSANFSYANLSYANLSNADLSNADLRCAIGNSKQIKSLFVSEVYPIVYTSEYLQIGCERHRISDWWEFDNERIKKMDDQKALNFWADWKEQLKTLIEKYPAVGTKHEK